VRIYWAEIAPTSDVSLLHEARIVLAFFARAAVDPALATPTPAIVDHLLTLLLGLQIAAPINQTDGRGAAHATLLDTFLASLRR